jgi:ditrans,polycis-polyprenyl diphosphate synthase
MAAGSLHISHFRKWLVNSPPAEWVIQNIRELLLASLRQGAVPQHVAFVMDGNRRFARSHQIETIEGHNLGFEALAKVHPLFTYTELCLTPGIDP